MNNFDIDQHNENKLNEYLDEQEEDVCSTCDESQEDCECEEYESEADAHENAMWDKADAQYEQERDER